MMLFEFMMGKTKMEVCLTNYAKLYSFALLCRIQLQTMFFTWPLLLMTLFHMEASLLPFLSV